MSSEEVSRRRDDNAGGALAAVPRVMSGMRTTHSQLHIGHYFGTLRNWLKLQDQYQCFFGAMDWHAMTSLYKTPQDLKEYNRNIIAEWIAWGLNPEKNVLFIQSMVPEHIELCMVFANLTPMGWLERVTTWKDSIEEMKATDTHNLGRFLYPVLQTADIAVYRGNLVPVGQDQVAHIELSREIVRRFNHLYKAKLPEPKPLLTDTPLIMGDDGRKMSKSYDNFLALTPEADVVKQKFMKMPTDPARVKRTDPGDPDKCPVFEFHKLFSTEEDRAWVRQGCTTAGIGCGDCKLKLFNNFNAFVSEPREKKKELLNNPRRLDSIIADGCQRAREEAQKTMKMVKEAMGTDI